MSEVDKVLSGLANAVTGALDSMKPVELNQKATEEGRFLSLDCEQTDSKWKGLLEQYLTTASTFEIHCWNEEADCIELALRYGELKVDDWSYGKKITGKVTPEFAGMLLKLPKPTDTELYNKMTPFFNLMLDSGFSSSHYGTEVCLSARAEM